MKTVAGTDVLVWEIASDGTIPANTPCIFKPTDSGSVSLAVSSNEIVADTKANYLSYTSTNGNTYTLSGTYVTKDDMSTSDSYGLYEGDFHPASSDAATLQPFRIYLNIGGISARAPLVCNVFQDGTTLIEAIDFNADDDTQLYDINGRHVTQPLPGLYITRNKKMIIK